MKTDQRFRLRTIIIVAVVLLTGGHLLSHPALAQTETGQEYVVQRSDSLWRLAEKYLGDGNQYPLIVEATAMQAQVDASVTAIANPDLVRPGQKIWIPGPSDLIITGAEKIPPSAGSTSKTIDSVSTAAGLTGHIAFSFWNNHPNRCTYEVNIIDVSACTQSNAQCMATRRILPFDNVSEPALSPDGTRIAFRGWGEPATEESPYFGCANPHPFRMLGNTTLDGTEFTGTGGFWEDSHPDWSPNGERIIFDTGRNGDGITRILTIGPDASNEEDLRIAGQQPSWAPDNTRFVYRGCDFYGNECGIRVAQATAAKGWETGNNQLGLVVGDGQASHPDWSPVADEIVYQSPESGSWDLYLVNIDGSNQRRLTTAAGLEGLPAWSPDGQWVAYVSFDGSTWSLRAVSRDGQNERLLFTYDGGIYALPKAAEPYGSRDWLDEQISWSR